MNYRSSQSQADRASALALEMRTLIGRLKRKLRGQAGHEDFTSSQVSVALRLEKEGPATVSSLARAEAMRPQSMSAAIAPLEAAGLVSGAPDPNDRRQTLLSLTPKCRALLEKRRAAKQDWLSGTIQARLSAAEQAKLSEALEILARLVED
ncbi:MAG TPA: MarR family transcriptional regulator [Terriglobia bacterium]|nr:MarR family transcriptional regulator [Terriglobia bacterium]